MPWPATPIWKSSRAGGGPINEADAAGLEKLPGVRAVLPVVNRVTNSVSPTRTRVKVLVEGIRPDQPDSIGEIHARRRRLAGKAERGDARCPVGREPGAEAGRQREMHDLGKLGRCAACHVSGLVKLNDAAHLLQGGMVLAPVERLQDLVRQPRARSTRFICF